MGRRQQKRHLGREPVGVGDRVSKDLIMSTIFADDHEGLKVSYSGLIAKVRRLVNRVDPGLSEMLHQLESHLSELGARWYAGDQTVVDEFLQLYTIQTEARQKAKQCGTISNA